MKISKSIKNRVKEVKYNMLLIMAGCGMATALQTKPAYAALGDSLENSKNTIYNESISIANVLGMVGIVVVGGLVFFGKRELAVKIFGGVAVGYLILKYAETVWHTIDSGI